MGLIVLQILFVCIRSVIGRTQSLIGLAEKKRRAETSVFLGKSALETGFRVIVVALVIIESALVVVRYSRGTCQGFRKIRFCLIRIAAVRHGHISRDNGIVIAGRKFDGLPKVRIR